MNEPRISVIVATRNEEDDVPHLIKSLKEQTLPAKDFEVVFADGQSTDLTQQIIKDEKRSHWKLIIEEEARGPAAGRNQAVSEASAPIIIFSDADNVLSKNVLSLVLKRMSEHDIQALSCKSKSYHPNQLGKLYDLERRVWASTSSDTIPNTYEKKVFEKLGGLDEDMGFGEDRDLAHRFDQAGYERKRFPEIVFYHREPQDWKSMKAQLTWYGRTLPDYFKKHVMRGGLLITAVLVRALYPFTLLSYFFKPSWFAVSAALVVGVTAYHFVRGLAAEKKLSKTVLLYPFYKVFRNQLVMLGLFQKIKRKVLGS